ncbi:MAG: DinB family protein [Gemmatimonadales bacterium]|nr:MAG: DinB family protein [Gemmatimonadales bacterium]
MITDEGQHRYTEEVQCRWSGGSGARPPQDFSETPRATGPLWPPHPGIPHEGEERPWRVLSATRGSGTSPITSLTRRARRWMRGRPDAHLRTHLRHMDRPETSMDAQRQSLLDALGDLNERADALFRRHTGEELHSRPSPQGWSIAECMEHMSTSLGLYLPSFEEILGGEAPRGSGPFAYGPFARGWIRLVGPGGPKLPSPSSMRPGAAPGRSASGSPEGSSLHDPDTLLADFKEGNNRLAELVRASEGFDLGRIRMRSPVIPLLRFPIGAWFETCVQHSRRHMQQAERLSERLPERR